MSGDKPQRERPDQGQFEKRASSSRSTTTRNLSLAKVARSVNISANYFSEKFNKVTGVKFVDYIARTRFEKAGCLLRDVDLRVSEIAFAVGFQSLSQFNRVFKKFSGKSPSEYRTTARAKRKQGGRFESRQFAPGLLPEKMRSQPNAI